MASHSTPIDTNANVRVTAYAAVTRFDRRAASVRGVVHPAFWLVAIYLGVALAAGLPLEGPVATLIATLVFIGGGMPHGAYDIALLARASRLGRFGLGLAVGGYIGIAAAMATLWIVSPLIALVAFLAVASVHFGEDWTMIDEPLLKVAAGTTIIAAPAMGHPPMSRGCSSRWSVARVAKRSHGR